MAEPLSPFVMWLHKMMRYLPHLAIVASLLVYAFFIVTERYSSIFNLSLYLIPLIGISIVLIVNKKFSCDDSAALFNISFKRLRNIHLIIFALTIICLGFGHDGWLYLGLMFVQYCLLLAQLFAKDQSAKWIVAGVMLTTVILILPHLLLPTYYHGDSDLLFHAKYAQTISDMGTITTGHGGIYESFNAYHILISAFADVTGLAINISLYLVSTFAVLFSVPVVYALGKHFTKSERIGAFAAFFYALLPIILDSMLIPAPRVMASMAFFLIVYMLFKHLATHRWRAVILSSILICYMVLVHHAQLIFIVAVIIGLLFGALLYAKKLNWKMIVGGGMILAVPVYILITRYGNTLTSIIQNRLFGQINSGNISNLIIDSTANASDSIFTQLLSINLSYTLICLSASVMIIFIFVGIYTLISNSSNIKNINVLLPLLVVTFVLFVPGIVDLFPTISITFQIYRLRIVLSCFFAIAIAIGCVVLLNIHSKNAGKIKSPAIIITLCLILILSSPVISGFESNDIFNKYSGIYSERYYTESDLNSLNHLMNYAPPKKNTCYTSVPYGMYFTKGVVENPFKTCSINLGVLFSDENTNQKNMNYVLFSYSRYSTSGIDIGKGYSEYLELDTEHLNPSPDGLLNYVRNTYNHNIIYESNTNFINYSQ